MSYPTYLVHFNKNHNPKNGQFTFGDGDGDGKGNDHGRRDGDGSSESPNSKYSSSLSSAYEHEQSGGLDKSFNLCLKALKNMGSIGKDEEPSLDLESEIFEIWPGYKSIAYLAGEGYDKGQIKDIMEVNHVSKVNEYLDYASSPYHKNFDKNNERYKELEEYIDECVKLAKEMEHSDMSDYLVHFNKNHDKRGRFAVGDGDGDGVRNERKAKKNNLEDLKEYFTKNAKRNSKFTEYAEQASGIKVARNISTGILGVGLAGAAAIGAAYLLENPVLMGAGIALAYNGGVWGSAGMVGSFIEEYRLTKLKDDFEKYDIDSGVDPTIKIKKA